MEPRTFNAEDYYNIMELTQGRWPVMTDDERDATVREYEAGILVRQAELHQEHLRKKWEQLCPPIYRENDPNLLPNLPMFEQVQKWEYGPEGLLLLGPSRLGKTRAAWALLNRLHFKEKRKIVAFNPMDLKLAVANAWRNREEDEPNVASQLRRAQILFLDDLDTIKFTEAVEETLYDAFEYRLAHFKPVIVSLNQCGDELVDRMSTEARGVKIVERMRESCRAINFG